MCVCVSVRVSAPVTTYGENTIHNSRDEIYSPSKKNRRTMQVLLSFLLSKCSACFAPCYGPGTPRILLHRFCMHKGCDTKWPRKTSRAICFFGQWENVLNLYEVVLDDSR